MPDRFVVVEQSPTIDECELLYRSVGWTVYVEDLDRLRLAIHQSTAVMIARDQGGALLGLIRALSDDATVCYVQDLLVSPPSQRRGVGSALLRAMMARFGHCRQFVLTTDASSASSAAFYRANNLVPHEEQGLAAYVRRHGAGLDET